MTANADEIAYWNDVAAPVWIELQAGIDSLMAPLTQVLLQQAVPRPGETIVDIGCGCGQLAFKLAEAVGAQGRVRALDVSKPMLAHAAARQESMPDDARAKIEWIDADASAYPFEGDADLLISRFGVMFFDDRRRAFANLRKALKPADRFAFLTWRARAEVEWMQKPLDWISPVLAVPEASDGETGPFGLADGEATREQLADAGFWNVVAEPVDRVLTIAPDVDGALALLSRIGAASRLLREAEEGQRVEATKMMRHGLESVAGEDGAVRMRAACWIYRGVAGAS